MRTRPVLGGDGRGITPAGAASIAQPAVVSENPSDTTPTSSSTPRRRTCARTRRSVTPCTPVGCSPRCRTRPGRRPTHGRTRRLRPRTGAVSPLDLAFNGTVTAIEATADGTALYISGSFSQVNGITRRGLVKYDLVNNQIDPTFWRGTSERCPTSSWPTVRSSPQELREAPRGAGPDDRRRRRRHQRSRSPRRSSRATDQGRSHSGLPGRHPVGGHGQLRHGRRPGRPRA